MTSDLDISLNVLINNNHVPGARNALLEEQQRKLVKIFDQTTALISDRILLNLVAISSQDEFLDFDSDALVFLDKRNKLKWF